ncbi:Endosulfine-domain-containing protein [Basidiobolus meristosporus CBS 931.73]|uniref:mRNA stability protein n=1 Tax=Basidiobolus meristosporus CBS 931.73 TaxID=1314790 RepID=A0A1Y1Y7S1_9FUNG|nr:Endosulfine-domain-containing protein [Basidiobolus meristosporus CBS 931.73]|eukprot:ORX93945.1 Endosulfine-domain-containing protein [Basidiobolus meristosporus CBS 931.73]
MLPSKQNKVDLSKLSEEEKKIFKMYGRLPSGKDLVNRKLKDRKYFDSGDYALQKAGKTSAAEVGSIHPSPETIPHPQSPPVAPLASTQNPSYKDGLSQLAKESSDDVPAGFNLS